MLSSEFLQAKQVHSKASIGADAMFFSECSY